MSLAGRIVLRVRQLPTKIPSFWWEARLRYRDGRKLRSLQIGRNNSFHVPVRSAGRGSLQIGNENAFGWIPAPRLGNGEILLQARSVDSHVIISNGCAFSNNVSLVAMGRIFIGSNVLIGDQVAIYDCDFHELNPQHRNRSVGPIRPVEIGDNVWLGSRVLVLKGVKIGENTVVAAGAIVTESLPANVVAAGIPARIVKAIVTP